MNVCEFFKRFVNLSNYVHLNNHQNHNICRIVVQLMSMTLRQFVNFVNVGNYVHLNNHQNLIYSLSNQGAINVCDFFKHFVNFVNVGNYVHLNNHHSQCVWLSFDDRNSFKKSVITYK